MLDTIPPPLLDRMELIQLSGYTEQEKVKIARRFILPRQIKENGLEPGDMTVPAARFAGILAQHAHEPHWVATILDTGGTVVARTAGPDSLIGQSADTALPTLKPDTAEGEAYTTVSLENVPILATYVRARASGFGVVVSVPRTILLSELRDWLWLTAGGTILLSLLGLGVALAMSWTNRNPPWTSATSSACFRASRNWLGRAAPASFPPTCRITPWPWPTGSCC